MSEAIAIAECAREPIHLIEAIQGHGALIALSGADLRVVRASAGAAALLGTEPSVGRPVGECMPEIAQTIARSVAMLGETAVRIPDLGTTDGRTLHATMHRSGDVLVIEFEPTGPAALAGWDALRSVADLSQALAGCDEITACMVTARAVADATGYDRVMIYRFAANDDGEVVAEHLRPGADSYLGLRFPASDIPAQARASFSAVGVRVIVDTHAADARLVPAGSGIEPLDLSRSCLRAVSPIHLEYLRNMHVHASLSAAIHRDGRLWGLIACHHGTAKPAPPALREIAALSAALLAAHLSALGLRLQADAQLRADRFQRDLLARFTAEGPEWVGDLMRPETILPLVAADGALLFVRGAITPVDGISGETLVPLLAQVAQRLGSGDLLAIESVAEEFPDAGPQPFAGLLAVRLSPEVGDLLVWTRNEAVRAVAWAGDPRAKVLRDAGTGRLSPRTSFAAWSEQVHGHCLPWRAEDLAVARAVLANLRSVIGTVYGTRRVLLESNRRFRDFAHLVAHDLQEPLRAVSGFCSIIQRRYGAGMPQPAQDYLRQATDGAYRMQRMIIDVLALAAIQNVDAPFTAIDLGEAVQEAMLDLQALAEEHAAIVRGEGLPTVRGHRRLLVQLLQNLIGNAIKYRSERMPEVRIGATLENGRWLVSVADNGIGVAKEHHQRMFDAFTRISRDPTVPGNGIGLALCRAIVEQHGGEIWVESEPGVGTAISFTLPVG